MEVCNRCRKGFFNRLLKWEGGDKYNRIHYDRNEKYLVYCDGFQMWAINPTISMLYPSIEAQEGNATHKMNAIDLLETEITNCTYSVNIEEYSNAGDVRQYSFINGDPVYFNKKWLTQWEKYGATHICLNGDCKPNKAAIIKANETVIGLILPVRR